MPTRYLMAVWLLSPPVISVSPLSRWQIMITIHISISEKPFWENSYPQGVVDDWSLRINLLGWC
jgi:hypothetical protein